MAKKTIKEMVTGFLGKIETTSAKYEGKLEEKQEEIIIVQAELQEATAKLKDFHKMKILGDISEETFNEQKKMVDMLQEKLQEVKTEVELIDTYKTEDVDVILAEINKVKPEFNKKQQEEIQKIKEELTEAKKQYTEKLVEIGDKYSKAVSANSKLESILIKFGKQTNSYLPDKYEIIGGVAVVGEDEARRFLGR